MRPQDAFLVYQRAVRDELAALCELGTGFKPGMGHVVTSADGTSVAWDICSQRWIASVGDVRATGETAIEALVKMRGVRQYPAWCAGRIDAEVTRRSTRLVVRNGVIVLLPGETDNGEVGYATEAEAKRAFVRSVREWIDGVEKEIGASSEADVGRGGDGRSLP